MGKNEKDVIIPVAPAPAILGASYATFIETLKKEISEQRLRAACNASADLICLYWRIGNSVLEKQRAEGWGAKVIDRMSVDLRETFPSLAGFSARNIKYMRKFAECWPSYELVQRTVALIPWRSNIVLMDKLKDEELEASMPDGIKSSLPTIEEIERELEAGGEL